MKTDGRVDPETDRRFMAAVLSLGWWHQGLARPNPSVGAILVRPGSEPVVIARGVTGIGGRPHGEAMALAMAGEAARGATAYVTLEPCSHCGRAGPCCEALAAAGVGRVVSAMEDPDPRVAGQGHAFLRQSGIALTTGVLEAEARRLHAGHISRILRQRPHVFLKLAVSADGFIGRNGDGQIAISGDESRAYAHALRAEADAIVVGIGTALADNPSLTCRLPGMELRSPLRVVLDPSLRLAVQSTLVRTARQTSVTVFSQTGSWDGDSQREALTAAGVDVRAAALAPDGGLDLVDVLFQLSNLGVGRLMVEGGARLARSLIEADLVDELHLVRSPVMIGPGGVPAFGGLTLAEATTKLHISEQRWLGRDRLIHYRRADRTVT
ncbi:Riboflavin biosynthesis protein RibD [Hartmannibacter diazotrophicus]|uniref:Riboflavin biosynthesis protein RibD n=1 Tax=Hartmannibacter diazotrophicus TaxID=1482074 RepID=A0A2C9D737_9HYPH|nr:bifunctional diaminohydroxyphosphoribosylaminopyrimidine deaminase/5-amino-6-(5-phosphoribosylamino)uracil reductase RibD [Hartmannibacter diazotrophicus]SON56134.1 Riboflavin biosynthesis protein RibD [Hartmannibacter diazotrophicus]